MRTIIVEKYNPDWKNEFEKAKKAYSDLLNDIDVEILHVGSTSVEGLWAKPILDIDIVVKDTRTSQKVIDILESVGYKHVGNLGIEGREVMKYEEDTSFIQ